MIARNPIDKSDSRPRARVVREHVDDPRQRVVAVVGVDGRQAQVAGQGVQERLLHGVPVSDLADHDQVRSFAQRIRQGVVIALGVDADLTLIDDRLLVLEQVFDRVLERQDVARAVGVSVIDHGRQRRRLARARRAGHQHQAALFHHQVEQDRRELQVLERRDAAADIADDHRDRAALPEDVDPEIAHAAVEIGKIHFHLVFEFARLILGHELVGDAPDGLDVHRLSRDRSHHAVDLDVDRRAAGYEKVGACFSAIILNNRSRYISLSPFN